MKNSECVLVAAACTLLASSALLAASGTPAGYRTFEQAHGIPWADAGLHAPTAQTQSFFVRIGIQYYYGQYAFEVLRLNDVDPHATGDGIMVAVLDTGVWADHQQLDGHVEGGYNFIDESDDTSDAADGIDSDGDGDVDEFAGHGTYLAGLIAAVAPDALILPVTVLDSDGVGTESSIASGIYYAIAKEVDVINLSIATSDDFSDIAQAVADAQDAGILVVASVANDNQPYEVYPAAYPGVIAVAATDVNDHKSSFSGYGSYVAISAPGTNVVGPIPDDDYGLASGSSAAAAFVSGAAALMLEDATTNDPATFVNEVLGASAVDIDAENPGYTGLLGAGRLDVAAAIDVVRQGNLASANAITTSAAPTGAAVEVVEYLDRWLVADPVAELTGDTAVDELDLIVFLDQWFHAAP